MEFSCSFAYSFKNINLGIVFLKIQHDNLHFHWSGMVISFNMTFQCAYFKSMILLFDFFFSWGESLLYSLDWCRICDLPASASQLLGYATPSKIGFIFRPM